VTSWFESLIDRQIREAQERGEFDNLPGAGKPLPGQGEEYDEDWWIKNLVRRENITGALPASLMLRREVEDVQRTVAAKKTEAAVRRVVDDLNERIRRAQRGHVDGPPVVLSTVDADEVVRVWRSAQPGGDRE
jgi:DnaJ homologue, subfamily C, member 28, conserved domain